MYEDKCQDWLNLKMGRLISPIGLDQVCKWNISTVEGSYITLEIKSFDVSAVLKACLSLMLVLELAPELALELAQI